MTTRQKKLAACGVFARVSTLLGENPKRGFCALWSVDKDVDAWGRVRGAMPCVSSAQAQERLAFVIGNGDYADVTLANPAKDAIAVSQTLLGLGFDVVRMENASLASFRPGDRVARTVALYFAGQTTVIDGQTYLLSAEFTADTPNGWPLNDMVAAMQKAGAEQMLVFVSQCQPEAESVERWLAPADLPGVFMAFAAAPGTECPVLAEGSSNFTDSVLAALATPDVDLADTLVSGPSAWVQSTLTTPIVLRVSDAEVAATGGGRYGDFGTRFPR